ncbi:hypothetical protein HF394_19980 (plasmid) [Planococcus glaciei]|uniref:Uncharacterized protein n=1 Tax=Planococcus glaciei TaxID=459472 RepID=A0A7H8QFN0_9BACL|nr:hypothetical protein [Planococcus glaciei]QKX52808.1 hypothetical protein HF394_19445 [Planococcus glaciei]QKX52908.1 hypothetical protein HF394_19980 [Planococcus glaciei]
MSKNEEKNNIWKRKTSTGKLRNVTAMPTRKNKSTAPEKSDAKKEILANIPPTFKYIGKVILATFAAVAAIYAVFEIGVNYGVEKTEQQQPAIIKRLENQKDYEKNLRIESDDQNKDLKEELEETQGKLEELQKSFDSLSVLQNKHSSGEIKLVSEPAETTIDKQDSAVFFNDLNVSIVNINNDTDSYLIDMTVSANNEVEETFSGLKVGDKNVYKYSGHTYEVLITSTSLFSVGVTVFMYQDE